MVEEAKAIMIQKSICPVCQSDNIDNFLTRKNVPIRQNTVAPDQTTAFGVTRGDLVLVVCNKCGFVFNAAFDSSLPIYGHNYDNAQLMCLLDDILTVV